MKQEGGNMHEQNDDMDWKLFQLLEGDLSSEEASNLLDQIESDDQLKEDWEAMQNTTLSAPQMQFPDKSRLLRKEKKIIPLFPFLSSGPAKVAAAVGIALLVAYPIWKWGIPSKATGSLVNALPTDQQQTTNPNQQEGLLADPQEFEKSQDLESPLVEENRDNSVLIDLVEATHAKDPEQVAMGEESISVPQYKTDFPIELKVHNPSIIFGQKQSKPSDLPAALAVQQERKLDLESEMELLVQNDEYQGLRPMIDKGLYALGAPFRNTVITLDKKEDQKPTLIMAYVGQKYQAMAMLELK